MDNQNNNNNKISLVQMAKAKRHLFLIEQLRNGKVLSKNEIKEMEEINEILTAKKDSDAQNERAKNKYPRLWTEEIANELIDDLTNWMLADEMNVFYKDFLIKRGVTKDKTAELAKQYETCAEKLKIVREIQESKIINLSAKNKINPAISIFVLKNKHGYSDKIENTNKNYALELTDTNDIATLEEDIKYINAKIEECKKKG